MEMLLILMSFQLMRVCLYKLWHNEVSITRPVVGAATEFRVSHSTKNSKKTIGIPSFLSLCGVICDIKLLDGDMQVWI